MMDILHDNSSDDFKMLMLSKRKIESVYKLSETEKHVGGKTNVKNDDKGNLE